MDYVLMVVTGALGVSVLVNIAQFWMGKIERDRIFDVLVAEKAPTYVRVEARKRELEAFASIEDDDEGDMPDGLI
jgi:hypothetical protein